MALFFSDKVYILGLSLLDEFDRRDHSVSDLRLYQVNTIFTDFC